MGNKFGLLTRNKPEIIKVPVLLSCNGESKEKLIMGDYSLILLSREYMEVHINYIYERPEVCEWERDEVLAGIEGYQGKIEQVNVYENIIVKRTSIQSMTLAYYNKELLYYINIEGSGIPSLNVASVEEGRALLRRLAKWWKGTWLF